MYIWNIPMFQGKRGAVYDFTWLPCIHWEPYSQCYMAGKNHPVYCTLAGWVRPLSITSRCHWISEYTKSTISKYAKQVFSCRFWLCNESQSKLNDIEVKCLLVIHEVTVCKFIIVIPYYELFLKNIFVMCKLFLQQPHLCTMVNKDLLKRYFTDSVLF